MNESEVAVADVLEKLKADLANEMAVLQRASVAVQHLKVAIAAIERDIEAVSDVRGGGRTTRRKRGFLSKAILDCAREGIGTVGLMKDELSRMGVASSGAAISSAIQRLQNKKLIRYDLQTAKWVCLADADESADVIAE